MERSSTKVGRHGGFILYASRFSFAVLRSAIRRFVTIASLMMSRKMRGSLTRTLILLAGLLTFPGVATPFARANAADDGTVAALRLVKTRCFSCHNEQKKKGGVVLTSREALLDGGENGPVIVAGSPGESALIALLASDADPHMPPKKQLSQEQIDLLSSWVQAGAPWDASALIDEPRAVSFGVLPASYRPVFALALSPDSKRLAVGSGNELALYNVGDKSIQPLARASVHPDPIQSMVWSPDGTRLATGAFRRVVIWNAEALESEREMTAGLTDRISALRFTPGGDQLIIADGRVAQNGTVRIVDVASGGIVTSWRAHDDTIFDLALSRDGQRLATAGGDKLVKVWDLATQLEIARIEAHAAQVLTVAFNEDATRLVTGGADQMLKIWEVQTRNQIMTLGRPAASINAVAWTAKGPAVFAVNDAGGLLRYTDFKSHSGAQSSDSAKERKYESAEVALYCIAVPEDGERVFAGTHDGRVLGWNTDGKLVIKEDVNRPDGRTALTR